MSPFEIVRVLPASGGFRAAFRFETGAGREFGSCEFVGRRTAHLAIGARRVAAYIQGWDGSMPEALKGKSSAEILFAEGSTPVAEARRLKFFPYRIWEIPVAGRALRVRSTSLLFSGRGVFESPGNPLGFYHRPNVFSQRMECGLDPSLGDWERGLLLYLSLLL